MANIANPLTATKVDGSTFTAGECNAVGAGLTRCLVNDGQSDLLANASVNGATVRSFAFAGMTTFGIACSGERTDSCGSYALTCSGDWLTIATGNATLNAAGNTSILGTGNVSLTAGVDVNLTATSGKVKTAASKFSLTGTGWPELGSRDTDGVAVAYSLDYSASLWAVLDSLGALQQSTADNIGGGQSTARFLLFVPADTIVRAVTLSVSGAGPGSATAASFGLDVMTATGLITAVAAGVTDNPASASAHTITLTLTTPRRVATGEVFVVRIKGLGGAGFVSGYTVRGPRANLTHDKLRLA